MLSQKQVISILKKKYNRHKTNLLSTDISNQVQTILPLTIVIFKSNEKELLKSGFDKLIQWSDAWKSSMLSKFIDYRLYKWTSSTQNIPNKVVITNLSDWLKLITELKDFNSVKKKALIIIKDHPGLTSIIGKSWDYLLTHDKDDIQLMSQTISWFMKNTPAEVYERQVPIAGIHTKWLSARRKTISLYLRKLQKSSSDYYELTGIVKKPNRIRMRILCPKIRKIFGNICDVEAPIEEMEKLQINPKIVLVMENLITGLAIQDIECAIVIFRIGYDVRTLSSLPWFTSASYRYYWGDIDTNGFYMLGLLRTKVAVQSLMMTKEIFDNHQKLCSFEASVKQVNDKFKYTTSEMIMYESLLYKSNNGFPNRLEQELIEWNVVNSAVNHIRQL